MNMNTGNIVRIEKVMQNVEEWKCEMETGYNLHIGVHYSRLDDLESQATSSHLRKVVILILCQ